jgi:hypothetical protein
MIFPFPLKFIRDAGCFVFEGAVLGAFLYFLLGVSLGLLIAGCFLGCFLLGLSVGLPMYILRGASRFSCVPRGALRFFNIYNITYIKKKKKKKNKKKRSSHVLSV